MQRGRCWACSSVSPGGRVRGRHSQREAPHGLLGHSKEAGIHPQYLGTLSGGFDWVKTWVCLDIPIPRCLRQCCRSVDLSLKILLGSAPWLSGWRSGKELACQCRRLKRGWLDPWVRKDPLEEEMATRSSILAVHGVAKSRTQLKWLTHACAHVSTSDSTWFLHPGEL